MLKYTLLAALLSATTVSAQTQRHFNRDTFKKVKNELIQKRTEQLNKQKGSPVNLLSNRTKASILRPLTEKEYAFTGTDWELQGEYAYTYDTNGNILVSSFVGVAGDSLKNVYEYNTNNKQTSRIESAAAVGETLTPVLKHLKTYDTVLGDLVVQSEQYDWMGNQWELSSNGYTWKRNISRNSKGNVKEMHMTTYYMGQYVDHHRTTLSYTPDGLAQTWKYEEVGFGDRTQPPHLEEWYTLRNMKWQSTDGQIVNAEISGFFSGNNKLKSARVHEPKIGETGKINATYEENGNYSYRFDYAPFDEFTPAGSDVFKHVILDANGSFEDITSYLEDQDGDGVASDNEVIDTEKFTVTYDSNGNVISEVLTMGTNVVGATRYNYTYDENGQIVMSIHEELNPETQQYEPFIKIVASNFKDVATGIDNATADKGNGTLKVFQLNGVQCGTNVKNLPAGVYVIQKGNRTYKYMKR